MGMAPPEGLAASAALEVAEPAAEPAAEVADWMAEVAEALMPSAALEAEAEADWEAEAPALEADSDCETAEDSAETADEVCEAAASADEASSEADEACSWADEADWSADEAVFSAAPADSEADEAAPFWSWLQTPEIIPGAWATYCRHEVSAVTQGAPLAMSSFCFEQTHWASVRPWQPRSLAACSPHFLRQSGTLARGLREQVSKRFTLCVMIGIAECCARRRGD